MKIFQIYKVMSFCQEETNIFLQYLSKTTRKSFENIERLGIFYKYIL